MARLVVTLIGVWSLTPSLRTIPDLFGDLGAKARGEP